MKTHRAPLSMILLLFGLTACVQSPTFTPPTAASLHITPTITISWPTNTPSPSPTATPQATLTPTPIPPSPSPSALPTTAVPVCWQHGGQIKLDNQATSLLPQPLQYRVYLPPCYDEQSDRHYPVLYLIHGQTYTDDQWDRLGADETADALIATGELPPFIIVMPRNVGGRQPSKDNFGRALVELLIPLIDQQYRTLPDRSQRAIGGLSRGASWAIHIGLQHPDLFSAVGAHSPPVFWEDTPFIPRWLDAVPIERLPRLYVDIGEDDRPKIMQSALWLEEVLTSKNIPHEWHLFAGEHVEDYWRAHMEQYLRWYAQDW